MPKQILSADKARAALQRGIDAVADPVKVTLGPRGRNVLLDRPGQPIATRDGVTVAKETANLPDQFENMGAQYAREVADACVTVAGDGTTTGTVILQAIVREGLKAVSAGAEPLLLADGIAMAAEACAKTIKAMAVEATPELVRQAAIISTHGDVDLGTMIAEATCKVGASGVLELQDSRDDNTTIEHMDGFYFERGWRPYQFFAKDKSGTKCVLKNPLILISERIIVGAGVTQSGNNLRFLEGDGLGTVMMEVVKARRPFLVIAEDLTGDALGMFVANIEAGQLPGGCFVKLPGFGDQRMAAIEDLRVAIGAKRIHSQTSTELRDQLSSFRIDDLGWCEQAVITPTRTVLINGGANEMEKARRVKQLMDQSRDANTSYERESLDHRIARLTNGVAVLRVGGKSEPEMLEKKARAEDAIHACRGALQEGLVPGGGVALLRAAARYRAEEKHIREKTSIEVPFAADARLQGIKLLLDAICEPARQIVQNAAGDATEVVDAILSCKHLPLDAKRHESHGYNAATGQFGDMYDIGIVDPCKVVLTALSKAASIGALLLTTEVLVTDIPQK